VGSVRSWNLPAASEIPLVVLIKGQQAIREFARAMGDRTGNLPLLPAIFPN
jgi:hypothetical protein